MSDREQPSIGHAVFFTLKDRSDAAIEHLITECKSLDGHAGAVYFNAGRRGDGFDRPVNDQAFDVALYVVFKDRTAHDDYQTWPTHKAFIERNKDSWAQVRVFDSQIG